MSVDIEKICRTCLALSGPLLSIHDGGTYGDTIADMLRDFTRMKPHSADNMPQKVCLTCISEINRCYSFKMKCENSNRTLRQLLPNAKPDEHDSMVSAANDISKSLATKSVQTSPEREISKVPVHVQTSPIIESQQHREPERPAVNTQSIETTETITLTEMELFKKNSEIAEIPSKSLKRRNPAATSMPSAKQCFKKKITESYKIDCDEDGYEFILKLDTNRKAKVVVDKDMNDQNILVSPDDSTIETAETYAITNEISDCEEYEIEAVVGEAEDPTVQSDDVVFVKTELARGENVSEDNVFIIKSIKDVQPSSNNHSKSNGTRKEYGCVECVMTFYSIKVLRRHMSKHHGMNINEVDLKDMKYRLLEKKPDKEKIVSEALPITEQRSNALSSGLASSTTESKYVCNKCNSTFSSERSLNYHKKRNICNATSYECDQCERVFTSKDNLESHKSSHKNAAIVCHECSKTFMTTEELSSHQISVHKRSAKNQCNICKKVFTMLSTLRDHLRTHSGEKPFLCTICGKAFTQSANLKQHIQRHDKDKKFKCDECPNSYVTKAELFSHKRSHNGDHPFKCEECSASFTTSSSLVKHRRRHTGERPYACDICPMRFAVLNVLKNHRRLHTGEKPFQCPHCDKRFTQKGDCMTHVSKHVEHNVSTCGCGKNFSTETQFRQHSKRCRETKALKDKDNSTESSFVINGEAESESQMQQDEDLIELNMATICGQSSSQ